MITTRRRYVPTTTLIVLLVALGVGAFIGRTKGVTERQPPARLATTPVVPQGSGYAYRRTVTIDHTKVPNTDQSNFPVLISGTYSYLATVSNGGNVQNANGYDVIFTSDAACATKLDHEVDMYSATTGTVNYWVRVPLLSHTTDTAIYMCYGNAGITTDQSNKTAVWDSNFKAVYHLNDQAANTSVSDSTANASNGVNAANTSGKSVSGKLGRALTYNGTTDNTATGVPQTSSFTWECWFKLTDWTTQSGSSNYSTLMAGVWPSNGALLMLWKDSGWLVQFAVDNVGGVTSGAGSVAPGSWHHAAYTRTGNNGTYTLYFDGEWKGQVASGTNNTNSTISLGTRADYVSQALNGLLDEARISNAARSSDWIKTQYNNQSSPATFYSISASSNCCDTSTARLDPLNATGGGGENPLSQNFNWNLPVVSLPGRAGMDLNLSLSYNSLVWTKSGNYISFDDDRGLPSPGFRVGFPVIQFPSYYNAEVGKNAFLLLGSDGGRTELRQVGTSTLYEAADSSYLLFDSSTMVLRTTDGTQLKYELKGTDYQCTEIKDRNGNYITINYTAFNRVDTVVDTLARSIKFNYDISQSLTSITQVWNPATPPSVIHNWAAFEYTNTPIETDFPGLSVSGPSTSKTLSKVTLADGSHYDFSYTSWGQVWKVSYFSAETTPHLLNYRSYNLPGSPLQASGPQADCPRFTQRRDWAENWNQNVSGVEQEAITTYTEPVSASWTMPDGSPQSGKRAEVTSPDGTLNKIYFIGTAGTDSGWQRGLPALVETYSGGNWQRKVMTTWTQDVTGVFYPLNPRITETNVYDPAGNRARVETTYQQHTFANGTSCQLPSDVYEYAANATTIVRSTRTDYNTSAVYTDRRIIGLVSEKRLYDADVNNGGVLMSKVGFFYDNDNSASSIQGNDAPVQHDNTNYTASFVTGRANLSSVRRYDVNNTAQFTTVRTKYNTAGAVVSTSDALNHATQISYTDTFSDGVSRNTLAYPTTITDPDNYTSTTKYNFDFGAVTYKRTPQPNTTQNLPGPEQTITYDTIGRLQRVTNQVNGAYTRYVYANTMTRVDTYATIQSTVIEAHSFTFTDGAGRVIGAATEHPGSTGGYNGQKFVYDVMGRVIKTSNPTETNASGAPSQWAAAGDDVAAGWIYSQQTYDWKNRPLVTTNQDGTTKTASYSGCGCAGGEVVTLTDEGTLDGGVVKRRQQRFYSDVLGRTWKTEVLNWDGAGPNGTGGSVYSAIVNTYNARNQLMLVRQYAGAEGSGTYQDTTMTYDGHGRLKARHLPEQQVDPNTPGSTDHTTWDYNDDDTIQKSTDARGASQTFSYNNRHLTTSITYHAPAGITIPSTVSNAYDAAGNRTSMIDGSGTCSYNYDQLSRMTSETHTFNGLTGNFTLSYAYRLNGALQSITDHTNQTVTYAYDNRGRVNTVTGTNYVVSQFINSISYRAWGAPKQISYGNGRTASWSYNERLQATHFGIPAATFGAVVSLDYQYYADGRVKYSQDLLDGKYDRSYEYDHLGRIKKALSGAEAQGEPPTQDRPYNETFSYDAFHHLTTRTTSNWSKVPGFFSNDSYTNNRRNGWLYDADGNLTSNVRQYTYDAAGRMIFVSGGNTNQVFDGNGQRVKVTEPNVVTYYLRSAVVGQVIAELDGAGTKTAGYIYLGAKLLARQAQNGSIVFEHDDPSQTKLRYTHAQLGNQTAGAAELDPLGADVYLSDPYLEDPGFEGRGEGFGEFGNVSDPSSGCSVDGLYSPCDIAFRLLQQGAAVGAPTKLTKYNRERKRFEFFRAYADGYSGYLPADAQYGSGGVATRFSHYDYTSVTVGDTGQTSGAWHAVFETYQLTEPQNTFDLPGITKVADAILSDPNCIKFAETILNQLSGGKGGSLIDVFNAFFDQPNPYDLFTRDKPAGSRGEATALGKLSNKTARMFLVGGRPENQIASDADNVVQELFHFAGKGYSDADLAKALFKTPYAKDAEKAFPDGTANIFDDRYIPGKWSKADGYSTYFHAIASRHCGFRTPNTYRNYKK